MSTIRIKQEIIDIKEEANSPPRPPSSRDHSSPPPSLPPAKRIKTEHDCEADNICSVNPVVDQLTLLLGPARRGEFTSEENKTNDCFLVRSDGTQKYTNQRYTEANSLLFSNINADEVSIIINTYRQVTRLHVVTKRAQSEIWPAVAELIYTWRSRLTLLKLRLYETSGPSRAVFVAINSMTVLKHLTLRLHRSQAPLLPILGRLEEFNFTSYRTGQPNIPTSLRLYGQANADRLTALNCRLELEDARELYSLDERLREAFTAFCVANLPMPDLNAATSLFPNLTELNIKQPTSLRALFNALSALSSLRYFSVTIDFNRLEPDYKPGIPLPALTSVTTVTLWLSISSHTELSQLKLATTIPLIQVLKVNFISGCATCRVEAFDEQNNPSSRSTQCLRQVFAILSSGCRRLRKLFHGQEEWLE